MFKAKFDMHVKIEGCPESGLAALDYRREHGLNERGDNLIRIVLNWSIPEADFRRLVEAGYMSRSDSDGSLEVSEYLPGINTRSCQPADSYGWRATVTVLPSSTPIELLVGAANVAHAKFAAEVEAKKQRDIEEAEKNAANKARSAAEYAQKEQEKAEKEQQNRSKLRDFLGAHASRNTLERFDAGVLPESELEALLDAALFEPFSHLERFTPIEECDVIAECGCEADEVKFNSLAYEDDLTAEQWEALKRVQSIAEKVQNRGMITLRDHVGYQDGFTGADDPEIRRLGIRVTIEFAGETVSREFAAELSAEPHDTSWTVAGTD